MAEEDFLVVPGADGGNVQIPAGFIGGTLNQSPAPTTPVSGGGGGNPGYAASYADINQPPPGYTMAGYGRAFVDDPGSGTRVWTQFNPGFGWVPATGPGAPSAPTGGGSTGPAIQGLTQEQLLADAEAQGARVENFGQFLIITHKDGTQIKADPSVNTLTGELVYNVSLNQPKSGGFESVSSGIFGAQGFTGAGTGAARGAPARLDLPTATVDGRRIGGFGDPFTGTGQQISLGQAVPGVVQRDPATGAMRTVNRTFDPGIEVGELLQRSNPFIGANTTARNSQGEEVSQGDFARALVRGTSGHASGGGGFYGQSRDQQVISLYGGQSTGDPLRDAVAAQQIVRERDALIRGGMTPAQAQQSIQIQQQVGRTSDPFRL